MRKKTKPEKNGKPDADGIGALLAAARNAKGIPIEQAAHETRIGASRLREIEDNDFSKLSHPTYARMFITDYARYLGVPLDKIREKLPEAGAFGGEGYQYLQELPVRQTGRPNAPSRPRATNFPVLPALAGIVLLILVVVGGFSIWLGINKIKRLTAHSPHPVPAAQVADASGSASPDATASPNATQAQDLAALHKEDAGLLSSDTDAPAATANTNAMTAAPDSSPSPTASAASQTPTPQSSPASSATPQPSQSPTTHP